MLFWNESHNESSVLLLSATIAMSHIFNFLELELEVELDIRLEQLQEFLDPPEWPSFKKAYSP